jgi:hypothetical protein
MPGEPALRHNVEACGAPRQLLANGTLEPARPAPPPGYVSSELIAGDVERSVKDTEDVDVSVAFDEVCDSVVTVEQYSHVSR